MLSIPLSTPEAVLTENCPAFGINPTTGQPCLAFNTLRVEPDRLVFKYNDIEVSEMPLHNGSAEIDFNGVLDIDITADGPALEEPSEVEPVTD